MARTCFDGSVEIAATNIRNEKARHRKNGVKPKLIIIIGWQKYIKQIER